MRHKVVGRAGVARGQDAYVTGIPQFLPCDSMSGQLTFTVLRRKLAHTLEAASLLGINNSQQ